MVYCQKIAQLVKTKALGSQVAHRKDKDFVLFENFNIKVDTKVMKNVFVSLNLDESRTVVDAELNSLKINLNREIVGSLKRITNVFIDESISYLEEEKRNILSKASRSGFIYVALQEKKNIFYAVLFNNYLYLY